jgi:hypothetical protein
MLEQVEDLPLPNWDPQWPQGLWAAALGLGRVRLGCVSAWLVSL